MSSNTNIGNTPVNQGYVQLIHTGETGGIDGTLRTLYDGDGTASDLQIASNKVKISTQLYIGSKTITEYVQDVVGDMFTTGSYTNITTTYDDTNGNIDLSASGEVTLTGTQTLTNKTLASPTFTGTANGANLTLTGDLTVSGDTIFTNSNTVLIGDAILTLNADETGSPTANAGFEVERGTSANKTFIWNETDDKWTIGSETFVASTFEGNLTGNVTGNVTGSASLNLLISNNLSDLASASTARTNLGVDAAGTDNSTNVTLAGTLDYITISGQTITRNAINLTTDVTGTLPVANGGTGATNVTTARENLGLEIGLDVQAYDAGLLSIAGLTTSANKMIYTTASDTYATTTLSATARTLLDDNTTADMLTTLGLTATATELNYTDGVTSNIQTQLGTKAPTTRSITPVSLRGISGGGDLSADRTIELSASQLNSTTLNTTDKLILFDANDSDIPKKFTAQDIFDTISGAVTSYTNTGDNRVLTSGGGTTINGESNLTFDGSTLKVTGDALIGRTSAFSSARVEIQNDATEQLTLNNVSTDGKMLSLYNSGTIVGGLGNDVTELVIYQGTTEAMRIDTSQNVGIGTNSPLTTLDVQGQSLFQGSTTPSYRGASVGTITINNNSADNSVDFTQGLVFTDNTNNQGAWTHAGIVSVGGSGYNGNLVFGTDGDSTRNTSGITEKMRITHDGLVGIGTNSPSQKLDIQDGQLTFTQSALNQAVSGRIRFNEYSSDSSVSGAYIQYNGASNYLQMFTNTETTDYEFLRALRGSHLALQPTGGNVGIGATTVDDGNLQIGDANSAFNIAIAGPRTKFGYDGSNAIVQGGTAKGIAFCVNNTTLGSGEAMRVTSGGNVGIGTTSPSTKLQVVGHTSISGVGNALRFDTTGSTESNIIQTINDYETVIATNRGSAGFGVIGNSDIRLGFGTSYNAAQTKLYINGSSGNVGIGTSSPQRKLHVSTGNTDIAARFENTSSNGTVAEFISSGDSRTLTIQTDHIYSNGNLFFGLGNYTNTYRAGTHIFQEDTGNTEVMRITGNNVGIGTASPTSKLHIKDATDISMDTGGNGQVRVEGNGYALGIALNGSGAFIYQNSSARFMAFGNNETEQVRLTTAGALHVDNDVVAFSTTPSDIKLKTNVKDIEYGLDTIMKLNPKQYDWKEDNRHDIGFIAQEVEEVIPEIVKDNEWFDDKIKTLDYEKLTAVLIKAIQEQQQQINKLEEKLNG